MKSIEEVLLELGIEEPTWEDILETLDELERYDDFYWEMHYEES